MFSRVECISHFNQNWTWNCFLKRRSNPSLDFYNLLDENANFGISQIGSCHCSYRFDRDNGHFWILMNNVSLNFVRVFLYTHTHIYTYIVIHHRSTFLVSIATVTYKILINNWSLKTAIHLVLPVILSITYIIISPFYVVKSRLFLCLVKTLRKRRWKIYSRFKKSPLY